MENKTQVYAEKTVITVRMGSGINQIYVEDGIMYAKASTIMKYIGYLQGVSPQYADRVGEKHLKRVKINASEQTVWFIDLEGFNKIVEASYKDTDDAKIGNVYKMFGVDTPQIDTKYTYHFTDSEMLSIVSELMSSPVNKTNVQKMLFAGRK